MGLFFYNKPKWHRGPQWERALKAYDVEVKKHFSEKTQSRVIVSDKFGCTQVYACGDATNPPVFLFHGMGANSMMFGQWLVPELTKHYYTICVDTLGDIGRSCPKDGDPTNIPADEKEFTEWFLDLRIQLGLQHKRAHLIGYSYGCYVASRLALTSTEAVVDKVCFIAPAGVFSGIERAWLARAIFCMFWASLMPTESLQTHAIDHFMSYMSKDFGEQKKTWDSDYAEMRTACGKLSPVIKMNPEELDMDTLKVLAKSRPTMLIIGTEETVIDPIRAVQRAKEAGTQVREYQDAGHMLYDGYPKDPIKTDVVNFLLGCSSS